VLVKFKLADRKQLLHKLADVRDQDVTFGGLTAAACFPGVHGQSDSLLASEHIHRRLSSGIPLPQ
jgi:hypothetical protein